MTESIHCYYCGDLTETGPERLPKGYSNPNLRTRDHTVSKMFRQTGESVPIVIACYWCNATKGSRTVEAWIVWLRRRVEGGQLPRQFESGRDKGVRILARWADGRIKKFTPREKPHLVHRRRNGLFVCTCGTISTQPCQIAEI